MHLKILNKNKGFTLIELMVSVSLFMIIMTISMGSILSIFGANQKSKTLRSVMDNLNITMESMTRTIRFGTNYHCGSSGDTAQPLDCGGLGDNNVTVRAVNGTHVKYSLQSVGSPAVGRIARSIDGGTNYYLTSPDVNVTTLAFRVYGSDLWSDGADWHQPQVIIVIAGNVGTKNSTKTAFSLETTVSQRSLDFQ